MNIKHIKIDTPEEIATDEKGGKAWVKLRTRFKRKWLNRLGEGPVLFVEQRANSKTGNLEGVKRTDIIAGIVEDSDYTEAELNEFDDARLRVIYQAIQDYSQDDVERARKLLDYTNGTMLAFLAYIVVDWNWYDHDENEPYPKPKDEADIEELDDEQIAWLWEQYREIRKNTVTEGNGNTPTT